MIPEEVESRIISRTHSLDSSSVKEVDPAAHFQQHHSDDEQTDRTPLGTTEMMGKKGEVGDEDLLAYGSELEDLLIAGKEELLKTSVLSLQHLSNEKIISLMQLVLDIGGHSQQASGPLLPKLVYTSAPGLTLWSKLISRVKTFVRIQLITSPKSRMFDIINMPKSKRVRSRSIQMSEAVAEVLKGRYLPDLQHLALPPCHISTIVLALIQGRVSTLQRLDLHCDSDPSPLNDTRPLRRLFTSPLLRGLQHLRLSGCMQEEEMAGLAEGLNSRAITSLRHLDLSKNSFKGPTGTRSLSNLIMCRALVALEHLDLSNCGISDEGMQALTNAISERGPWKLKLLNLESNDIGDVGFASLLKLVNANRMPNLQELRLLYNYRIGEGSKIDAAKILEHGNVSQLQVVYLSSHIISERVAEAFFTAYKNNTGLFVELRNVLWPNELVERGVAHFRERNLGLLFSARKSMH